VDNDYRVASLFATIEAAYVASATLKTRGSAQGWWREVHEQFPFEPSENGARRCGRAGN
jgi:hypothetical protein